MLNTQDVMCNYIFFTSFLFLVNFMLKIVFLGEIDMVYYYLFVDIKRHK